MSVFHNVCEDARAIQVSYLGKITSGTILKFFDQFESCLQRHPGFCEVVDLTAVERVSISSSDLACLFSLIHCVYLRNCPNKEIAFVVTDHSVKSKTQHFVDFMAERRNAPRARIHENHHDAVMALNIPSEKRHQLFRH